MPLMERMRGFTKFILYTLVGAFVITIIFDWGMQFTGFKEKTNVIGEVNGHEIPANEFMNAYNQELTNYRARYNAEPGDSQEEFILNQIWEQFVQSALMGDEIAERKLGSFDKELLYYLQFDPPEILKRDSSFMNAAGQFDNAKYRQALLNQSNEQYWLNVENYLRNSLPSRKLQSYFDATVFVTASEVREEYIKQNQKAKAEYIFLDKNRFRSEEFTVSDDEIRNEFEKRKEEFKQPERRKIDYVLYATNLNAQDSLAIKEKAQEVLDRAKSGDDFTQLVLTYSDDEQSSARNGDLDFFKKGAMVKPFSDAAFAAKKGDIVGPVESQFGVHIIKVTDRKKEGDEELVRASHILFKYLPTQSRKSAAADSAEYLASTARSSSWEDALAEEKVIAQSSPSFQEGSGFVPGIGLEKRVSKFAFGNVTGTISAPFTVANGYVVIRVSEILEERLKTLEMVKSQIKNELLNEKKQAKAGVLAAEIKTKLNNGASFASIAKEDTLLKPISLDAFARNGYLPNVGKDPAFIGSAFSLKPNQISDPVKGDRGYYIIKGVEVSEINDDDFKAQQTAIRADLKRQKQQTIFSAWYAAIRKKAEIKDLRKIYF